MDSTIHGILQARILELVAVPFSRGSSQHRDRTQVSRITGRFFTSWATEEAQAKTGTPFVCTSMKREEHWSCLAPRTFLMTPCISRNNILCSDEVLWLFESRGSPAVTAELEWWNGQTLLLCFSFCHLFSQYFLPSNGIFRDCSSAGTY